MTSAALLHVAMGEVKMARRGETLTALLGSCVAIAVIWPKGGRCALAHCLLPESPASVPRFGARYVDQALPSLLSLMGIGDSDKDEVEVVIAGGARMLRHTAVASAVGVQNAAAARKHVASHGLRVRHIDTGGLSGRKIQIDAGRMSYTILKILHDSEARDAYA